MKSMELERLKEDERIYLNVPYVRRGFAKYTRCGFEPEKNYGLQVVKIVLLEL